MTYHTTIRPLPWSPSSKLQNDGSPVLTNSLENQFFFFKKQTREPQDPFKLSHHKYFLFTNYIQIKNQFTDQLQKYYNSTYAVREKLLQSINQTPIITATVNKIN